jgi:hypothetical protein
MILFDYRCDFLLNRKVHTRFTIVAREYQIKNKTCDPQNLKTKNNLVDAFSVYCTYKGNNRLMRKE